MAAVMAVVHEKVHQRTGEDQQIRQHPEHMRRVLGQQEEPDDNDESAGHQPDRGSPPRRFLPFFAHWSALSQRPRRRVKKLKSRPKTTAMYQPQMKLSAIPRQKLRQVSSSNPGKKIDSA